MESASGEGIVYVATGEKYVRQAIHAVRYLKEFNPGVSVAPDRLYCMVSEAGTG